jgi:hypothetical protein
MATIHKFNKKLDATKALEHLDPSFKLFLYDIKAGAGMKAFWLMTYETVYEETIKNKHKAYFYENIEKNVPVKLHFDIDFKLTDPLQQTEDYVSMKCKEINSLVREGVDYVLKTRYKIDNNNHVSLRSSGITKVSLHIIYDNLYFNTISNIRTFYDKVIDYLKTKKVDEVILKSMDPLVYRAGCFRLLYSSKKQLKVEDQRPLMLLETNIPYSSDKELFMTSLLATINFKKSINLEDIMLENKEFVLEESLFIKKSEDYTYDVDDGTILLLEKVLKNLDLKYNTNQDKWNLVTFCVADMHRNCESFDYKDQIYNLWKHWCKKDPDYVYNQHHRVFRQITFPNIDSNELFNHVSFESINKFKINMTI